MTDLYLSCGPLTERSLLGQFVCLDSVLGLPSWVCGFELAGVQVTWAPCIDVTTFPRTESV